MEYAALEQVAQAGGTAGEGDLALDHDLLVWFGDFHCALAPLLKRLSLDFVCLSVCLCVCLSACLFLFVCLFVCFRFFGCVNCDKSQCAFAPNPLRH
eukprot:COSAG05_NODE_354_length_10862_cov_59.954659_5_plen_97_part_00